VLTTRRGWFPIGQRNRHGKGRIREWSGLVLGAQRRGKDENGYLDSTSLCDCSKHPNLLGTADARGAPTAWWEDQVDCPFSWLVDEGFKLFRETLLRCPACQTTCFMLDELEGETSSWLIGYYTRSVGPEKIFYGVLFAIYVEICMNVNFSEAREHLSMSTQLTWSVSHRKLLSASGKCVIILRTDTTELWSTCLQNQYPNLICWKKWIRSLRCQMESISLFPN